MSIAFRRFRRRSFRQIISEQAIQRLLWPLWLLLTICLPSKIAGAVQKSPAPEPQSVWRRIVVIPLDAPLLEAAEPVHRPALRFPGQPPEKHLGPILLPEADPPPLPRLRELAAARLPIALADSLKRSLRLTPASPTEAIMALHELSLTPALLQNRAQAERFCRHLNADALLLTRVTDVSVRDGVDRVVTITTETQLAWYRAAPIPSAVTSPVKPPRRGAPRSLIASPPDRIVQIASALTGQKLFRTIYNRPARLLALAAADRAAGAISHRLRTGQVAPLTQPGDRIAIGPTLAPVSADLLLFTPAGRRLIPHAITGLEENFSGKFLPDCLPVTPDKVIAPGRVTSQLRSEGLTLYALWKRDGKPDIALAARLAKKLKADYILMARVTSIDLERGTSELGPERGTETSAKAAAMAYLVRADGTILWKEECSAEMTLPEVGGASKVTRTLCQDAGRFALLELQRRWQRFRSSLEQ